MDVVCAYEMSVSFYQATQCHIPEDGALHSSPCFSAILNFLHTGSYKNEELHWSEIKITVFWDVMVCSLADVTSTLEEPAASIFMAEE